MKRAKLLIENFFAYGVISILNKIIPFLLLPIITRLLTDTADFGIYDMYNTIVSFGTPLVILGVYDAMFREFFDKEDIKYKYNVTATANRIILVSSITISSIMFLFNSKLSNVFFGNSAFGLIVVFSSLELILTSNKTIISAPTRIRNKRTVYVISGIAQSLIYYLLAILLIKMGYAYNGLIYANLVSSAAILIYFWLKNKDFFTLGKYDKKIAKELLRFGIPLVPTFMIFWIFHSMDKIMISNMLGTAELGIYSIGARVASVSSIIYNAFAGGWQYFAYSTMRDNDYKKMMGKIWEILFVISSCFFIVAFIFKDFIFNVLFTGEYRKGVIVFPYLLFSPFIQMLIQVLGTQYHIIKKTYYSPILFAIGALVNIGLNYLLIPKIGIEGASIATLIGFVVVLILSFIIVVLIKKLIIIKFKALITISIFTFIFIYFSTSVVNFYSISLGIIYILFILLYYKEELRKFASNFKIKKM